MKRKVAWVTGANRGLGHSLARSLKLRDFRVVSLGRTRGEFADDFHHIDLSDPNSLGSLEAHFDEAMASADSSLLIHNAAISKPVGQIHRLETNSVFHGINSNLSSAIVLAGTFIRSGIRRAAPQTIVLVSSGAAVNPIPGSNVYCIAKAGIEMLVAGIQSEAEFSGFQGKCFGFRPGVFKSGMQDEMRSYSQSELPALDMYLGFKEKNLLREPATVAEAMCEILLDQDLSGGRTYPISEFVGKVPSLM